MLAKCRSIVTYLHKSPQALELPHKNEQELGTDKLGVVQDVSTRWNSSYFMVNRLKAIKEPLVKTLKDTGRNDIALSRPEWEVLDNLITCLHPFAVATV